MHKQIIKDLINQAASINLHKNWILGVFKKKSNLFQFILELEILIHQVWDISLDNPYI